MATTTTPATAPAYLTLDAIREADDLRHTDVDVPEWGGPIRVRGLRLEEARDIQKAAMQGDEVDTTKVLLLTVQKGLEQPHIDQADMYVFAQKHAGVVMRIAELVNELTGGSADDVARAVAAFRGQ